MLNGWHLQDKVGLVVIRLGVCHYWRPCLQCTLSAYSLEIWLSVLWAAGKVLVTTELLPSVYTTTGPQFRRQELYVCVWGHLWVEWMSLEGWPGCQISRQNSGTSFLSLPGMALWLRWQVKPDLFAELHSLALLRFASPHLSSEPQRDAWEGCYTQAFWETCSLFISDSVCTF